MIIRTSNNLGELIASERYRQDLTQAELAEAANVSRPWLSELEAGKPTAEVGKVLAVIAALDLELKAKPQDQQSRDRLDNVLGEDS